MQFHRIIFMKCSLSLAGYWNCYSQNFKTNSENLAKQYFVADTFSVFPVSTNMWRNMAVAQSPVTLPWRNISSRFTSQTPSSNITQWILQTRSVRLFYRRPSVWNQSLCDLFSPSDSSVQSPDRLSRQRDVRDDSAEVLLQSFLQEALLSSSGMGKGCPLFDVVHPTFPLPTMVLPTLQGALKNGFEEAVMACDHASFHLLTVASYF